MSFVKDAYDKGSRPRTSPSDALLLRDGRAHRVLGDSGGRLTVHGAAYEAHSGEALPVGGFDSTQTPTRSGNGNSETIKMRGGKESVVRKFDLATGNFTYTRLGRTFYSQRRTEYVVRLPVKYQGTRPDGSAYTRDGYYPVAAPISLPQHLTRSQRDARIRQAVQLSIGGDTIAEFSEETVTLRDAPWHILEMTTQPTDGGPETSVTERRLGANPVVSSLLFPEHICAAAFLEAEDRMCCPRQISAVTGLDFEMVCEGMDDAERTLDGTVLWRERGCTAKMIFEYARVRGLGACLLHSEQVVETLAGSRPLTFAIVANHAYFYDSPRVARALSKRRPHDFEALKRCLLYTSDAADDLLRVDLGGRRLISTKTAIVQQLLLCRHQHM